MMKTGIGSISVCLIALAGTTLVAPNGGGEIAPATAVAQAPPAGRNAHGAGPTAKKANSKAAISEQTRNEATEKKLEKSITIDFVETPLSEAIDFIAAVTDAQFYLDEKALDAAGLDTDVPVTLRLKDVPTSFVVEIALRRLDLGYHVRHGVVIVTTPEALENHLEVRVYDVRDLVSSTTKAPKSKRKTTSNGRFGGGESVTKPATVAGSEALAAGVAAAVVGPHGFAVEMDDNDRLVELITTTVTPSAWDEVGGPASIMIFRGAAVISHTSEGHRKASKMLADLRAALK